MPRQLIFVLVLLASLVSCGRSTPAPLDSAQICPPTANRASSRATVEAHQPAVISSARTAIAEYDGAIQFAPNDAEAYHGRAFAYQLTGDVDRSIYDYSMAIEIDPGRCDYWVDRGSVYRDEGDVDRAIADYSKALELDPACGPMHGAYVHNVRGLAHVDLLDYDQAIADYDKATQIAPDYAWAYGNRGRAYAAKGDLERAIADYDKALQVSGFALAHCYRGLALAEQGKKAAAARDLEECVGQLNCGWGAVDEDALLEQVQAALRELGAP